MDVNNAVVFWGAPQFMCPRDAKAIINGYLIPLEKEMMKEDPCSFPLVVHGAPWPDYELVPSWLPLPKANRFGLMNS